MSPSSLQVLADKRNKLLLAEVAALLHDAGKFCNLHIEAHSQGGQQRWANDHAYKAIADNPAARIALQPSVRIPDALRNILNAGNPKAADFLPTPLKNFLATNLVNLMGETYALDELIMLGTPGFATSPQRPNLLVGKTGWLAAVLGVCHNEAHVDKQELARGQGQQNWPNVFISDAFGIEQETLVVDNSPNSLTVRLQNLQPNKKSILEAFTHGLGDTRRPINEVLLSDWGWMVASLFKSAVAGALLSNQQAGIRQWQNWREKIIDHDLRWRLLRVNFDVLGLYAKAIKIADLLGYQRAVEEACDRVKHLVEEEYPLGNEIYRDSTGIYFTFPDLDLPTDLEQVVRHRVEEVEPELAPRIAVTSGDGQTAAEQLKGILAKARHEAMEALAQPFDSQNLSPRWEQLWKDLPAEGKWEVCPVCRLRPKEEKEKKEEHVEVCTHCDSRRALRLGAWQKEPSQTIWIGEVADHNDRVALLVGKFGLDDWLSGDLVQTLLVKAEPNNPNGCVPKNPSPARLRRVWETCQRFWEETVCNAILSQNSGANARRKRIVPNRDDWQEGLYNGKVNGKPIDLFWQPDEKAFLTISNLQAAGAFQPGDTVLLERPETKRKAEFQIRDIQDARSPFDHYRPFLPLHTSPDQFLAIVPAAAALKIVEKIRDEYEKQFGKVRNRLPLFLGLIYAERKMPLLAMMDAARAMLDSCQSTVNREQWKLASNPQTSANGQTLMLEFENGISWQVPVTMGDGQTEDVWYPYFALENPPAPPRTRQFTHDGKTWVHVKDLQQGDFVSITPSRFDFLWLDTAARRFEADYDQNGRRPTRPTRPFYLEDFGRLEGVWKTFSQPLTRTQIHQVLATIETARERWFGADAGRQSAADPAFRQFVADTLANAEWDWKKIPIKEALITAAACGELADWAELHLEILKEKKE